MAESSKISKSCKIPESSKILNTVYFNIIPKQLDINKPAVVWNMKDNTSLLMTFFLSNTGSVFCALYKDNSARK